MTTAIKRRRGTTVQHSTFTGLEGELTVDTTKDTVVVHDGATAGGFALLREDLSNNTNVASISTAQTFTNKTINLSSNTLTGTTAQFNTALSDGDFATLAGTETLSNKTFSTNPTISSGTANGVAYLNGSKVLTSGSALTFDGTNLGVGTSTPNRIFTIRNGGPVVEIDPAGSGGTNPIYFNYNRSTATYLTPNHWALAHIWSTGGGTETMRLTGTGLGIGTSSPTAKLTVSGNQSFVEKTAAYIGVDVATSSGNGGDFTVKAGSGSGSGNTSGNLYLAAGRGGAASTNGYIAFGISQPTNSAGLNAEQMRLDSSGNLGLGVTPSAWGGAYKAMQIGRSTSVWSSPSADIGWFSVNSYFDGTNYKYISADKASYYLQYQGAHVWTTAPSGTAGNAISFTQAMTLDASGYLSLTSPAPRYTISPSTTTNNALMQFSNGGGTGFVGLDSSTGSGLGAAYGLFLYHTGSYPIVFANANTERMRIDSSGNLLVGTTAQDSQEKISVLGSGTEVAFFKNATNTSGYSGVRTLIQGNGNNTSTYHYRGTTSGINNWYLYGNGTSSYSSDERLKKNIETTRDGYLDDVMNLRVVKYNWKNDPDNTLKELGLIAQEVERVFPGLVQNDLNPVSDEDPTIYKQLKQSVLPFILLKAIQELKAELDATKAEVAALKQGN